MYLSVIIQLSFGDELELTFEAFELVGSSTIVYGLVLKGIEPSAAFVTPEGRQWIGA